MQAACFASRKTITSSTRPAKLKEGSFAGEAQQLMPKSPDPRYPSSLTQSPARVPAPAMLDYKETIRRRHSSSLQMVVVQAVCECFNTLYIHSETTKPRFMTHTRSWRWKIGHIENAHDNIPQV